jgi:hypothetical protein
MSKRIHVVEDQEDLRAILVSRHLRPKSRRPSKKGDTR